MLTTNPSQKNAIDDLLYFFRSTVQMTSDEMNKKMTNLQLLFSLESSNDPLIFLTVLYPFIIYPEIFSRFSTNTKTYSV